MVDPNKIIKMIQEKVGDNSPGYKGAIETALGIIWAEVAARIEFIQLHSPDAYKLPLVVGTAIYEIKKKEIGKMRFIGDVNRKKQWNYVEPESFSDHVVGTNDAVAEFTMLGMKSGKIVIQLTPKPSTSEDFYLYYIDEGNEGNISSAPSYCGRVLYHGAMSILAPPIKKQNDQGLVWWKSVTRNEADLYEFALNKIATISPVKAPIPDPYLDDLTTDRLEDINTT